MLSCILTGSLPPFIHGVNKRLPWPAEDKAIIPFPDVKTKLNFNCFPYDTSRVMVEKILVFWVCYNVPCNGIPTHCDLWLSKVDVTQQTIQSAHCRPNHTHRQCCTLLESSVPGWKAPIVFFGGRPTHSTLCISPSLLILPDLLTHYVLKLHYFQFPISRSISACSTMYLPTA